MTALIVAARLLAGVAIAQDPVVQSEGEVPPATPSAAVAPLTVERLPPELVPWVDWVLGRHPDLRCPIVAGIPTCVWPGALDVDAGPDGASIHLSVTVDRDVAVPLPGGKGAWPQDVRVDGGAAVVLDVGGVPLAQVSEGRHELTATIRWQAMPQSLAVPSGVGQVELTIEGERVPWVRIDEEGLRLGAGAVAEREGERLDLEVSRRVRDGVPVVVDTEVVLRAAGRGREVSLGDVLVPGSRPVSLTANLPARFTAERELVVQVRPGTYRIALEALHEGPATSLSAPTPGGPWPAVEYWAVATDERVRAVNLSGPAGIDPARTTLPEAWRALPAFAVEPGTPLQFEELRRGEPVPPPNQLALSRELWLDTDGGGFTVRDRFHGSLRQGWRLNVVEPAVLGHVADADEDRVVTRDATGAVGVELRAADVAVVAESRIPRGGGSMAAVGWDADVIALDATLHLPPGWSLFAGTGVDNLDSSVLARWTLFDLFFVLVLGLAVGRLLGWRWGALTLAGLALGRHQAGAPQWTWAVLVALVALGRVVPAGWPRRVAEGTRWVTVVALVGLLVPFAIGQLRGGLFPALTQPWLTPQLAAPAADYGVTTLEVEGAVEEVVEDDEEWTGGRSARRPMSGKQKIADGKYLTAQVDPTAVVQTGPGVPTWTWEQQPLRWTGPVGRDHRMRLFLLGPAVNLGLSLLRVLLLVALAVKLAELRHAWHQITRAGAMAVVLLVAGRVDLALAAPDPSVLAELEQRLTVPPSCASGSGGGSGCATVPHASIEVVGESLIVEAEVHAAVATSWPAPGPTGAWVPSRVTLDGAPTSALARRPDGFLHVRVPAGVHRVRVEGPLPPVDALTLQLGLAPREAVWRGDGWAIDGLHGDGTVENSVQIARVLAGSQASESQSTENLAPWLEVHRELDLGIPWRVRTTIRRVGPTDHPLAVKVPLLEGEAVTESGFEARDGVINATLDRDQGEVSWISSLPETETLTLVAPEGVPWTEQWTLSCSPVFACVAEGPAPLEHVRAGSWSPLWRPWPGEGITLRVSRPEGVEGQTVTVDRANLRVRPGRRQQVGELALHIRSSQGGRQVVTLPAGAALQSVRIDGVDRPIQAREGSEVQIPLNPGAQEVVLGWQLERSARLFDQVPAVDLGSPAVNVSVVVEPPQERWIAALYGPRWGPTPMFWTYVILVVLTAPLLARLPFAPLRAWQWALLGLGMTQVPVVAPICVALWFVALGWRSHRALDTWWAFDLVQVALAGWTLIAVGCLYGAIHSGLLLQPDMQVAGGGSSDRELIWFVDRVDGALPRPSVVSLPMWVWRVLMLAWSLWLAGSLVRWLPWAWRAWSTEGLVRLPPPPPPRVPPHDQPTTPAP